MKSNNLKVLTVLFLIVVLGFAEAAAQTANVISVSWSGNGSQIAGGLSDGTVQIKDAASGQIIRTLFGDSPTTPTVAFNRSGAANLLATGGATGIVKIWNADTGELLHSLTDHATAVTGIDWNPINSNLVAAASYGGKIVVWDAVSGNVMLETGHSGSSILDIAWSPDGSKLIVTSGIGLIIWDGITGDFISTVPITDDLSISRGEIASADWGNDPNVLVSVTNIGEMVTWNSNTGNAIHAISGSFTGTPGGLMAVRFSPDGNRIVTAGYDQTIRVWDTATGQLITTIPTSQRLFAIDWSPDGTQLVYGGENGLLGIATLPLSTGTGLRGAYYNNQDFTAFKFFRLNPTINFSWGSGTPDLAIAADTFSIRWSGQVEPLYSETYTFYVTHNDGARLWVNGQQILNNWTNRTTEVETASTPITLIAGVKYDIVLEYYEYTGAASAKLAWSSPSQAKGIIPASQLYSPEGQLAFTGIVSGNRDIYLANPDGSGELNLSNHTALDTNPIWSPDGSKVAFVSARDGNEELYLVNADGSGLRRLTNSTTYDNQPAWSPDGTKLAFSSGRTGAGDIYIIDITGTGIPAVTRRTSNASKEYTPAWSPNGLWITYTLDVGGTNPEVYLIPSGGGTAIRLTNHNGIDTAPFWSPDGSKIAFRAPYNGVDQIWVVNTTSPYTVTRLTSSGTNYFQAWSPDGTRILFHSLRDGNAEVYLMNIDGSGQTRLTNSATNESYSAWAPDARHIAFVRSGDIYFINPDGSGERQWATPGRTEIEVVWWQSKQT